MAKWGLSGQPIPGVYTFAAEINLVCASLDVSPCAMYAIAWRETLGQQAYFEKEYGCPINEIISPDGGHGIFQLTSSFPEDWKDVRVNTTYAVTDFYDPFVKYWLAKGFAGTQLLRLAADSFNAGIGGAEAGHEEGNADKYTTNANYGTDVVTIYGNLVDGSPINAGRPS